MTQNVAREVAALGRMTVSELRSKHVDAFGEPTRTGNRDYLVKRIAWRLQANAHGDLSEQARRRADELANDADLRTTAPKVRKTEDRPALTRQTSVAFDSDSRLPMAGSNIKRLYKGREIVVRVLPKGFEHEGEVYRTLSAVAKAITGTHWNGYHFFNLKRNGGDDE
ncbi:MAG: DUF2924 domain-containing protein [Kiritimatiellia bacterium]|jgi:hypothetical protein